MNPKAAGALILITASTVGMMIFAGLYFFQPRQVPAVQTVTKVVTNTVTCTVTNEVTKEVPITNEVEKILRVPAEIPENYQNAMALVRKMTNAPQVTMSEALQNIKDIKVRCSFADELKALVSDDEVKAKFELAARRNNVPVIPKSDNTVHLLFNGFLTGPEKSLVCYNIEVKFAERQLIYREGDWYYAPVIVWTKGSFGTVGKLNAKEQLLKCVEEQAELFANDFLACNPKKQ